MVLVTVEGSRNRRRLGFGYCRDFLNNHALCFALSARTAGGQPNHPQCHHALRIDAKLRRFERDFKPRVEQKGTVRVKGQTR